MYVVATCTASILRGTTTDTYGDAVDTAVAIATGVIASIREEGRVVFDPNTQEPRVIRAIKATMPAGTDVVDTDQVRDDTHGITYIVQSVTQPREPGFTPDLELSLKRIT